MRLSIEVLGRTVLLIETGTPNPPAEARSQDQPEGEAPGPITERVANPITQIGFQPRQRFADGRERWR